MSNDQLNASLPVEIHVGDIIVQHFSGQNFLVKKEHGSVTAVSAGAAISRLMVTSVR